MKHLLNNLTEEEKNSIRNQHKDSIKVVTENFSRLINAKSGEVKPFLSEQDEMGDEMINKPGSGDNLRASVNVVIKNLTKGTEEDAKNKLYKTEDWSQLLSKIESGENIPSWVKESRGYGVGVNVDKKGYNAGDSIVIEFEVPFTVTDLKQYDHLISKIDLNEVGPNSTKITINAKVESKEDGLNFMEIVAKGETDMPSPLDEGEFINFVFVLQFRK